MQENVRDQLAAAPSIDQVKDDILVLQRELASLVDRVKSAAVDGSGAVMRESAEQLGDGARMLYQKLTGQGDRSVKALGRQIEAQPVVSLLVAFGIGFCASRLLSR